MGPRPGLIPDPIPTATPVLIHEKVDKYVTRVTAVAPLTTTFTPPPDCARHLPTIITGSCADSTRCSVYNDADFSGSALAVENMIWWTTNWQQNGPLSCFPPGKSAVNGFYYSPAVGCPLGYGTLTWKYTQTQGGNDQQVVCCPAGYSRVSYASVNGNYWCTRYLTLGETGVMVAAGDTTAPDRQWYEFMSVIATTTLSRFPTGMSGLLLRATAVELRIPPSLATGTPRISASQPYPSAATSTGDTTGPSGVWSTYDGKLHLFKLSYSITVVVITSLAIVLLSCCCFCFTFLKRRRDRRRIRPLVFPPPPLYPPQMSQQTSYIPSRPVATYTPFNQPFNQNSATTRRTQPPIPTTAPMNLAAVSTPLCHHKIQVSCITVRDKACCLCEDRRNFSMQRHSRVSNYCARCRAYWTLQPTYSLPHSWDEPPCAHKGPSSCIQRVADPCCECRSPRHSTSPQSTSTLDHCTPCKVFWADKQVYCTHKLAIPCALPPTTEKCCTCEDEEKRPFLISKATRIKSYCAQCTTYWRKMPIPRLPVWWKADAYDELRRSYNLYARFRSANGQQGEVFEWLPEKRITELKYASCIRASGRDEGPKRGPPEFQVPPTITRTLPGPAPEPAEPAQQGRGTPSRRFTPQPREPQSWDRHVQRNTPKFQVSAGGTLDS